MPGTHFTLSSGSERVVVYPDTVRTSSGSASLRSPSTSGRHSAAGSADSDGWIELDPPYDDDGIEPSDSASRSRQPSSRRHTTEAPPPPSRRHSSRHHVSEPREEPRRPSSHRHRSARPHRDDHPDDRRDRRHRADSARIPSDESSGTLAPDDDYPYPSHHGPPPPRGYPPSGYRHVPAPHSHGGGYPPSMTAAAAGGHYPDAFQPQALVHMSHTDAFGYPTQNPFSPGPSSGSHPFSPLGNSTATGYFSTEPHAPPVSHHQHPPRPPGPLRPTSMYAPSSAAGYPSDLYHAQTVPYPGYPVQYPQMPFMYAQNQSQAGASQEKTGTSKELENLRELIRKHEEERVAREKAMIAKAEADAAEVAARKAREEEEKKKKEEIAVATSKAKEDAEKKAKEAADKAKEESDKKLADAQKAKEEAEKKKKDLEEEVKKNKPTPDSLKAPIVFKDAVGRKFSFPWSICKTWKGMDTLIRQAFAHVDLIGQHVLDGHYDLTGPNGEIILPQVWESTVQPNWEIEMHLWPMPEAEKAKGGALVDDPFANLGLDQLLSGLDMGKSSGKRSKKDSKRKSKSSSQSHVVNVPPMHAGQLPGGGGIVPPPHHGGGLPPGLPAHLLDLFPPGISPVIEDKKSGKSKSSSSRGKKSQDISPFAAWIAGGSRGKKR